MKVTIDSKTVQPGDYFIPVKEAHFDGHERINDVIAKGAHVLDVDLVSYAKLYRKKLRCKVIAIVGSAGKTTVKGMLSNILSQQFSVVETHDHQAHHYALPLTILSADHDTDFLLIEFNMKKKGDLAVLTQLVQPDAIVFTGVGMSHIEFFNSQYYLALAKAEVFRRKLQWQSANRVCFFASSGAYYDLIFSKAFQVGYHIITYTGDDKVSENINLCYQLGAYYNVSMDTIEQGITTWHHSSRRMNRINHSKFVLFDDTFSSSPSEVLYAFQYLSRYDGRKIAVLGDMLELGSYSKKEHMFIGKLAHDYGIDMLFLLGEHMSVLEGEGMPYYHFFDKDELIRRLKEEVKQGDIILVKGARSLHMDEIVTQLDDDVIS
ncbi:hypothetical protein CL658_05440 [bacterium]|nr:hypothetical protein [bacterium]|tara:strand:- start:1279 stop:2409 length:1131 start_codon:yes stop_codon:yes gene_type:complete